MIVKDCAADLRRCLDSLHHGFIRGDDEIVVVDTGSTDDTMEVAKEFGARVLSRPDLRHDFGPAIDQWLPEFKAKLAHSMFSGGVIKDFAQARQIGMDAAQYDAIFWLDSDDVFVEKEPGKFRRIVDDAFPRCDEIFLDYDYSFDERDKRVTTILKRERVVDRRNFRWVGKCHEVLIPTTSNRRQSAYLGDRGAYISHVGHRVDHQISDTRNYLIIRTEIEEDLAAGRQPDTRSIFYLGNAARGLMRFKEATNLYERTMQLSGSIEDRFSACYYCAIMNVAPELSRPRIAADYCMRCIEIKPEDPRSYFLLAQCMLRLERWNDALHWYKVGAQLPFPETMHSVDPEHVISLPLVTALQAAHELGDNHLAAQFMEELKKRRPGHPELPHIERQVQNWIAEEKLVKACETLYHNSVAVQTGQVNTTWAAKDIMSKIVENLNAVPPSLEERGVGKLEGIDPRAPGVYGDVAIWCGHTAEPWGPESVKTGFGGSEKMVLCMAPRLQKRGFRVTVYCSVPFSQRGVEKDTNVMYRHWSEFDMFRPRDTVIYWRQIAALDMPIPAKKRIVWCHDVQRPEQWTPDRCAIVDQVWLLTKFHITTLGPEAIKLLGNKIVQTRNGLDRLLFEKYMGKVERKPNRILYCSSPDRGVMTAINVFQKAFANDPTAELHIGYGFTKAFWHIAAHSRYLHICDVGRAMACDDYYRMVMRAVDGDPRIRFHGRLNWDQLAQLQCSSGVWLYPTRFDEISCMAAMEAQAAGCAIVATEQAALAETIGWGLPGTYPTIIETAAEALRVAADTDFPRENLSKYALQRFDFEALAEEWTALLK